MNSEIFRTKNKRLRKTILEEHMPPEMQVRFDFIFSIQFRSIFRFQEAFFGMDLANQNRLTNPLDDASQCNANLKSLDNEYSIELDADTIKCLSAKKKGPLSIFNDDEHEMRKINEVQRVKIFFVFVSFRTDFW